MDMYLVQLLAEPTKGSEEYGEVGGAYVDAFVKTDSLQNAAIKTIEFLLNRSWVVTQQTAVFLLTPERLGELDEVQTATYHRAKDEGFYSSLAAWPVQERENDYVEVRSLKDSDKSSGSKH
ncbi:hypothetical protein [Nitrincola sp. MINF-07-Sa-05]|uniref:hypothetical protein n=1 Tax=Nitrincola salilacus TaxID=3400273 RepID=UPI0039180798